MAENQLSNEILLMIPLRKAIHSSRGRRADTAIKIIKESVARYAKSEPDKIWIDSRVNELVWSRGKKKIPQSVQVKIIKLQEGTTEVLLP
ncbi:MAG: 50S ribosomal protein L31e [Thermoplasmataceae archaeon]